MARMSREDYLAEREKRVESLTESLADRVAGIATGAEAMELLAFTARFRSRSPQNAMLIFDQWQVREQNAPGQVPQPTLLAGYKQFQEMGRQVRRGEKGYEILAPVTARFASATPDRNDSWRRLAPREKPAPGETVKSQMVAVKPATVFDISQTDGPEIPSLPKWAPMSEGVVPEGLRAAVEEEIKREGFRVVDGSTVADRGGAEGVTNYVTKTVTYNGDRGEVEQVTTLLHELGHIKLHRPDGDDAESLRGMHRGQREFEAEAFAHVVAGMHGLDTGAASDAYAGGWTFAATRADPSDVAELTVESAKRVGAAVNSTLDRMPIGAQVPNGALPQRAEEAPATAAPARATADARVRNAMRMEAMAPARIRDEAPTAQPQEAARRSTRR